MGYDRYEEIREQFVEKPPHRRSSPAFAVGGPVTVNGNATGTNGEVRSVSSSGAEKGVKLERFDLIPVGAMRYVARHFGIGASKYKDRNWEKGYEFSKSYAALQRHLHAFWSGEDMDTDPSLPEPTPHLAAAAFHVLALLHYSTNQSRYEEFDDRPKEGK